jgi:hypothetical protein
MPREHPLLTEHPSVRRLVLALAAVLTAGVLTGCGSHGAEVGAKPFSDPTPSVDTPSPDSPTLAVLEYPSVGLTVRYPVRITGVRKAAIVDYARFLVALQRAFASGKVGRDLDRRVVPASRATIADQVKALHKAGHTSSAGTIVISKVKMSGSTAVISACSILGLNETPSIAVLTRVRTGPFLVSTLGSDRTRKAC